MFEFLKKWDDSLASYERDMEFSLKGKVRSWIVYAQIYCERLFRLYNNSERILDPKATLGEMIYSNYFMIAFSEDTGYTDFNTIREIAQLGNEVKHESEVKIPQEKAKKWFKSIYRLSVMTYNYLNEDTIDSAYDEDYFVNMMNESDAEIRQVVEYADQRIIKQANAIHKLKSDLDVMAIFADEDRKRIDELEKQICEGTERIKDYNDKIRILNRYINVLVKSWSSLRTNGYDTKESAKNLELPLTLAIKKQEDQSWESFLLDINKKYEEEPETDDLDNHHSKE